MLDTEVASPQGSDPDFLTIRHDGAGTTRYALTHTFHNRLYGVAGSGSGARFRIMALGVKVLVDASSPAETVAIGYTGESTANPPRPVGANIRITNNYSISRDMGALPDDTMRPPSNHFRTATKYYVDNFNGSNRCREWYGHDLSDSNITGSVSGKPIKLLTYFLPSVLNLAKGAPHNLELPSFASYYFTNFSDQFKFGPVAFNDPGFMNFP